MTDEFSQLTAELRAFADRAIDVGAGLGESVLAVGLSGGGALATWAAVERAEVTRTILFSPLLNPARYAPCDDPPDGPCAAPVADRQLQLVDPEKGADNVAGMVYPRYS